MAIGIHLLASREKRVTIAAFTPANKEYHVVVSRELSDMWHSVGHLTANGIIALECRFRGYVSLNILNDVTILIEVFRCLLIKVYVF